MNTRSSSSSTSSPSQATAFGAFLVALRAVVVTITARALPPGSGFSFAQIPTNLPRQREPNRIQRWAKETRARVSAALRMLGHEPDFAIDFDVEPGAGAVLDVAIIAACLGAVGRIGRDALAETLFVGGLGFPDAERIVGVRGVLPMLRSAEIRRGEMFSRALVPATNKQEACNSDVEHIFAIDVAEEFVNDTGWPFGITSLTREYLKKDWSPRYPKGLLSSVAEILDVRTIRALVIAAAGGHGIRLIGRHPRTLDAARLLRGLLPPMTEGEAVETSTIWSAAGMLDREETRAGGLLTERPFRAPHHSAGDESTLGVRRTRGQAYVGGGDPIYPGELSLAHEGVLFLEDAQQIHPSALEVLASALGQGECRIRSKDFVETIPATPRNLVIAVPPCPYDPRTEEDKHARYCDPEKATEFRDRPLRKLRPFVNVSVEIAERSEGDALPEIEKLRAMVERAWDFVARRRPAKDLSTPPSTKIERVARTIADLDGSEDVLPCHVEEARLLALSEVAS